VTKQGTTKKVNPLITRWNGYLETDWPARDETKDGVQSRTRKKRILNMTDSALGLVSKV